MADKTVPVYVINEDGSHTQVGWATPDNGTGVRSINLLAGFENTSLSTVHFDDVEPFVGTDIDPATTQEPPRTYEESVGQDFVDLEGNVLEPADPEGHFDPEVPQTGSEVTATEEIPEVPLPTEPVEVSPEEPEVEEPLDEVESDPEWDALIAEEEAEAAAAEIDEDAEVVDEDDDQS